MYSISQLTDRRVDATYHLVCWSINQLVTLQNPWAAETDVRRATVASGTRRHARLQGKHGMARSRAYAACPPLEGNNGRVTHKCQKPRNVVPDKDDFGSKLWLSTRTNAARFILLHLGAPVVLRPPMYIIQKNIIGPCGLRRVSSFHQSLTHVRYVRCIALHACRPAAHSTYTVGCLASPGATGGARMRSMGAFQI